MLTNYFLLSDSAEGDFLIKSVFINSELDLLIKVNNLKTGQNYKAVLSSFKYALEVNYNNDFCYCLLDYVNKSAEWCCKITADEYEQILNF